MLGSRSRSTPLVMPEKITTPVQHGVTLYDEHCVFPPAPRANSWRRPALSSVRS